MDWETQTQEKFKTMIDKMPMFHRHIAEAATAKKAVENAKQRGANLVEEKDVVEAFFTEVPKPFYSLMIRLLDNEGFDYKKYGFPKKTQIGTDFESKDVFTDEHR